MLFMSMPIMMLGPNGRTGFSGWPHYLMCALQKVAAADQSVSCVDLKINRFSAVLWGAIRRSSRRFYGISQPFLDRAIDGIPNISRHKWIVCFQIVPSKLIDSHAEYYMYVDMTLDYYMSNYGLRFSKEIAQCMLDAERRSYESARGVFCFEEETKWEIVKKFALSSDKIHVVGRGVNIDEIDAPFTIGFVGRDPLRKGLHKLVSAIDEFDENERSGLRVMVIGPKRHEVPRRPYIDYRGYFGEPDRRLFVDTIKSVDVGFLASDGDSMPGGVFELLSLGKPVITTKLPGLSKCQSQRIVFIDPNVSSLELKRAIMECSNFVPRIPASLTEISWPTVAHRMLEVLAPAKSRNFVTAGEGAPLSVRQQ
jgi:glycosyltransferase involved in cell wall biosynthesis